MKKDRQSTEQQYLEHTLRMINEQLDRLRLEADEKRGMILSSKKELREETSHSLGNLNNAESFEQLVELSQFAAQATADIEGYEYTLSQIERRETQLDSPYFARIDFLFEDESKPEKVYIGRFSLMDENELTVYDWRSPIAGLFYSHGIGEASYEAPMGRMRGRILLKRQYEIKQGRLEYFFDADLEIMDDFLRKALADNASPKMKNIVQTIQRDQDMVIRDMHSDLLMVQGAAGSGKTSIAMHRAAYILYQEYDNKPESRHIVILSPHSLFEQYISNVLPELGEENITSLLLDELLEAVLKKSSIRKKDQLFEALMSSKPWIHMMKRALEFKTSIHFARILDEAARRFDSPAEAAALYKELFDDHSRLKDLAGEIPLPGDIDDIIVYTQVSLHSDILEFDDASAIVYLYLKGNYFDDYRHIRHVIIDEAQDYYPIHFDLIRQIFPKARFTLLGDVNQTVEKQENEDFYRQVREIMAFKKVSMLKLDKSFRSAAGIMRFAAGLIGAELNPFGRESAEPQIRNLAGTDITDSLRADIEACNNMGYGSVGILCKTQEDSDRLYHLLSSSVSLTPPKSAAEGGLRGVIILPVYLSKGLEFDAVIIPDADEKNYRSEGDAKLLYIASTRALHWLKLYYDGNISPILERILK